jgi:glyoxylase I family protein
MQRVTGIGGVFFRAKDPAALKKWYADHLGVTPTPTDYAQLPWFQQAGPTVYEPFPDDTRYFGRSEQAWMINFRVRDLEALVAQLRAAAVDVTIDPERYPNGRFARLQDPEGNPVELWEPQDAVAVDAVGPVDHVELFVPDRDEAARWYQRVLGLTIIEPYRQWADNPHGPLMISSDDGRTKLALFTGQPQGTQQTAGFHRVAFRVGADGFLAFLRRLPSLQLSEPQRGPVSVDSAVDHQQAFSIYFSDPYGHRLEVTTYEHAAVRAVLPALAAR